MDPTLIAIIVLVLGLALGYFLGHRFGSAPVKDWQARHGERDAEAPLGLAGAVGRRRIHKVDAASEKVRCDLARRRVRWARAQASAADANR